MTMKVNFDALSNNALFHAEKNSTAGIKALNKISSGLKINSAGDNPAAFSISESMKVKLRALDQNSRNVQSGNSILNTASDGIAQQIDLLRTIRSRVINAANDSNSDEDRLIIQKELNNLYSEMENIAYQTQFNSMKPLLGNFQILSEESQMIDKTALNLIPDEYDVLDNVNGPFDIFSEYSSTRSSKGERISNYSSGTSSTTATIDFSSFSDVSQLNNRGIRVNGTTYVFTDDTSKNYGISNSNEILLGNTLNETIDNLVSKFSSYGATRNGNTIQMNRSISTATNTTGSNVTYDPTAQTVTITNTASVAHTVASAGVSGTTSGGISNISGDADIQATKASLTVSLANSANDSGFTFNSTRFRVINPGATVEGPVDRTLTKGQSSTGSTGSFDYTFDGNNLTFTAKNVGSNYNNYSISGGYTYYTYDGPTTTTTYSAYTAFSGAITNNTTTTPSTPAVYKIDLPNNVDDFSAEYAGKILQIDSTYYKFHDSAIAPKLEGFAEDSGSRNDTLTRKTIDINDIRLAMAGGSTLAEAVATKLNGTADGDSVKFTRNSNSTQINLITENLRHYDIDFSELNVNFPNSLYGKGFRAYCATDNKEWFNFVFTDGTNAYTSDKSNIKSININVSGVTNVTDLVQAIYDQGNAALTAPQPNPNNHHLRLAADLDNKIITIYDHRRFDVSQAPYAYQELGAKIADGFLLDDFADLNDRDYWIKDFVIQDTDSADMNIRIKIPQMTLDQIFNPLPNANKTIYDYSVTDKASRDALLGTSNRAGILDIGLKYLLEAAASVGAQNKRLEFTAENISTESTNLTATNSVLVDADMAKEMTEYTKRTILTQASQAMLAQANQVQAMVISLLKDKGEVA